VLDALGIARPVVLAGHSAGGAYARAFAGLYDGEVAGLVLVDSSHEAQEQVLIPEVAWHLRALNKLMLPVMLMVPRKARSGADRRSLIREMRALERLTPGDKPLAAGALGDRPLIVITAGPGKLTKARTWQIWHDLHADLAGLSANRRHIVAGDSGHFVYKDDPDLVITAIRDVLHSARSRTPLTAPADAGRDR
jgi:pimeloyl-ACP methyl ester carboxylesterase